MILVTPWLKYYLNANPLIYPLEERFIQQISTSLKDIGVDLCGNQPVRRVHPTILH